MMESFRPLVSYFDRRQRSNVGLINEIGEMNCFLNAAIQALWSISEFREALLSYNCRLEHLNQCIACSLKGIFQAMQSELDRYGSPVDIIELRLNMSDLFSYSGEFTLGNCADSMEAFLILLTAVHSVYMGDPSQGINSTGVSKQCHTCPAHQAINLKVSETNICLCGASTEIPWDYCNFSHPFYVGEFLEEASSINSIKMLNSDPSDIMDLMEYCSVLPYEGKLPELMRKQWESVQLESCPNDYCSFRCSRKVIELNSVSLYFAVNCIWVNSNPSKLEILQFASTIPLTMNLDKVYANDCNISYEIRGIILYGGRHYLFFVKSKEDTWVKIDDERSKEISRGSWIDVIKEMIRSKIYPTGLIYEQTNGNKFSDISLTDWIKLELEVVRSLNPDYERNRTWECSCRRMNPNDHNICANYCCVKPGVKGWVCKECTFLNEDHNRQCAGCNISNNSAYRKCEFCNQFSNTALVCLYCNHTEYDRVAWRCQKCNFGNKVSRSYCFNCRNPKELQSINQNMCSKCGIFKPGNECYNCNPIHSPYPNVVDKCESCKKNITDFEKFNCTFCGRLKNSSSCSYCRYTSSYFLCNYCIDKKWICKCGLTNGKGSIYCRCGITNQYIR